LSTKITTFSLSADIVLKKEPPTDLECYDGDTLRLEVAATGHPYPKYQWFFCPDGESDFKRLQGHTEKTLRIEKIT